jgi:hypothetical protein
MFVSRGFGAAPNCPSLEQLMGISDPTDPCQNPAACAPGATLIGGTCYDPSNPNTVLGTTCPAGSTCTMIAGVPDLAIYALGGIVALFILMGVAHK